MTGADRMNLLDPSIGVNSADLPDITDLRELLRAYRAVRHAARRAAPSSPVEHRRRAAASEIESALQGTPRAHLLDDRSDDASADNLGRWLRTAEARDTEAAQRAGARAVA